MLGVYVFGQRPEDDRYLACNNKWGKHDEPGRMDIEGNEWWACDPYPTWFRWEGDVLHTDPARFIDEPEYAGPVATRDAESCYGHDNHSKRCDQIIKPRWSGIRCDCGARWFCY